MSTMMLALALTAVTPQMPISLAGTDDALAVFANPAGLGAGRRFDLYYLYNARRSPFVSNSSVALNLGPVAAFWEPRPTRWGVAAGTGAGGFLGGVRVVRDSVTRWDCGAIWRPLNWLSVAGLWQDFGHGSGSAQAGLAVRPVGNRLTLFAETDLREPARPVVGLNAEPVNGLGLSGRVRLGQELNFTAGASVELGRAGFGVVRTQSPLEYGGYVRFGTERRRSLLPQPKRYLDLRLSQVVQDQKPGFSLMGPGRVRTTWDLLKTLDRAAKDRSVQGIALRLDGPSMSFAHAQEVRQALAQFRQQGKRVVVHSHGLGMLGYLLASGADRIVTHPMSDVVIPGVAATTMSLKGTLDKLGVKAQPTRHGKYKSAVEAFTEDSLTAPNREQYEALVAGIYDEWVAAVASGRSMAPVRVESLVNRAFFMAPEAESVGLIDTTCYDDQLDSLLRREFGRARRLREAEYARAEEYEYDWRKPEATVAVIYASGSIGTGESGTDFLTGGPNMGSATIVRAIRQAKNDRNVKAVVLRIDSPGGDGFASDLIWRELELCRKKKPVIVSMAELAASGGYYIACNADRVFALPTTITGSIGVFSLSFVTEGLYNKLGIRRQSVKRGEHSDMGDAREMTAEEDSMVQAIVDRFYDQFVQKVADGRHLTTEHVDSVGQGRVWVGRDAVGIGLVDSLGGLPQAIEYARNRAGLRDCEPRFYPRPRTGLAQTMEERMSDLLLRMRFW